MHLGSGVTGFRILGKYLGQGRHHLDECMAESEANETYVSPGSYSGPDGSGTWMPAPALAVGYFIDHNGHDKHILGTGSG